MMIKTLIAALALVTGCGPTVEYVPTSNVIRAVRIPPESVAVFFGPPPCPYAELGFVETTPLWPKSHNEQLWQLRTAAGKNGADAIIIADHREPEQGHGHHGGGGAGGFTAIAVAMSRCPAR